LANAALAFWIFLLIEVSRCHPGIYEEKSNTLTDEYLAAKGRGNDYEHQMEVIKASPGIVTKESEILGGRSSGGLGIYERQDREIRLAKGLPGHRLEGYDVRGLSDTLFFEWILGAVLCSARLGQSS
jgi:hypothetical protein